jgi:hypothetical protein
LTDSQAQLTELEGQINSELVDSNESYARISP